LEIMAALSKVQTNVTPELQAKVLRFGVLVFAFGLVMSVVLVKSGIHSGLRSVLFVPFFLASNAIGMGLTGTCPMRARKGLRCTGEGDDRVVPDRSERSKLAQRGRILALGAASFAASVTVLFMLA
jgi:hypothetical protein